MKLAEVPPQILERLKTLCYDRIIEKHEGPFGWSWVLEDYETEFISIDGRDVLLPIESEQLPNIEILRCVVSNDEKTLTIFLMDRTFVSDPKYEKFDAGRLAICQKVAGMEFYIAVVYHEWFVVENQGLTE